MPFTLLPCTILHLPRCATCHPLGSSRSSNRAVQPSITGTWVHGCFFTARTPYSVGHWQSAGSQSSSGGPQSRTTKQGRGRARARGEGAEEVPAALTHPPLHHLFFLFLFLQSPRFHPPHHHLSINGSRYGVGTQPSSLSASTDPGEQ